MSKQSKTFKLVVKHGGEIGAIYDDALLPLFKQGERVSTVRASHVEPDGCEWCADLSPVSGPKLEGFETRAAALDAERDYLNELLERKEK